MKKILIASALTLATASSVTAAVKHGVYLGAGLSILSGHHNAVITYTEPPFANEVNTFGFSKAALGGDIMLGYMAMINSFLVGAEVDYMLGNLNRTNSRAGIVNAPDSRTSKVESTGGAWGFGVRLGYSCWERIIPYIRLGLENRRFKLTHTTVETGIPTVTEINSTSRKTAFTPGLGVDIKVAKNIALGFEYRYAFYGAINKSGNNPGAGRGVNFKVTPRISTALLSVKYVWGA